MPAAWAWARSELRDRWRALAALTLMIGLLGGAALCCLAGARRGASAYDRLRRATLARDVTVQIKGDGAEDVVRQALRLPTVQAGGEVFLHPVFSDIHSDFDLGLFLSPDAQYGSEIDRPRVLHGRLPLGDRPDEVVINDRAATQLHARVGDTITLSTLSQPQLDKIEQGYSAEPEGPRLRLRVTGVTRLPEDLRGEVAGATVLATPAFDRTYGGRVGKYVGIAGVRLRGGEASLPRFEDSVRRLAGDRGAAFTSAAQDSKAAADAMGVIGTGLALLGAMVALAGLVAGGQALSRQLWVGAQDQPVLSALGMDQPQRMLANVLLVVPVALAGMALTAGVAFAASPLMPINLARQAEPRPGLSFDVLVLLGGAVTVAVLVLLGSTFVSWRVTLATREGHSTERPSLANRIVAALRLGPAGVAGVRMALHRGSGRHALPVRPALAGAAIGIAGVVAAVTFGASLDRLVATPARYGTPWDLSPDLAEKDAGQALGMKEIGAAGVVHASLVRVGGKTAKGYSMRALKGRPGFTLLAGRLPERTGEVALGPDQLSRLHATIGGRISLVTPSGPRSFRVVGKAVVPGIDSDPIGSGVVLLPDDLAAAAQNDGFDQGVIYWARGVPDAVAERRFRAAFPDAISAYSHARPPGNVANLDRVGGLPGVLAGLLALIGLVATGHALVSAVRRRRHDLAVLRTLGFVRRQVAAAVAWQSTTVAVVGIVVGVPVGLFVGQWVWAIVASGVGVGTDVLVPVLVVLVVPAALVAANLLAALPGWRAARVRPATVLRVE